MGLNAAVVLSGETSYVFVRTPHHHPQPTPQNLVGGGTMVSTFPLSCRERSFVSCIPFPIHLFLPSPSWTGKKKLLLLFTRGRDQGVHLINL